VKFRIYFHADLLAYNASRYWVEYALVERPSPGSPEVDGLFTYIGPAIILSYARNAYD